MIKAWILAHILQSYLTGDFRICLALHAFIIKFTIHRPDYWVLTWNEFIPRTIAWYTWVLVWVETEPCNQMSSSASSPNLQILPQGHSVSFPFHGFPLGSPEMPVVPSCCAVAGSSHLWLKTDNPLQYPDMFTVDRRPLEGVSHGSPAYRLPRYIYTVLSPQWDSICSVSGHVSAIWPSTDIFTLGPLMDECPHENVLELWYISEC